MKYIKKFNEEADYHDFPEMSDSIMPYFQALMDDGYKVNIKRVLDLVYEVKISGDDLSDSGIHEKVSRDTIDTYRHILQIIDNLLIEDYYVLLKENNPCDIEVSVYKKVGADKADEEYRKANNIPEPNLNQPFQQEDGGGW